MACCPKGGKLFKSLEKKGEIKGTYLFSQYSYIASSNG